VKREQGLLIGTVLILGLMTWGLLSSDGLVRKLKAARSMNLEMAELSEEDLVVSLTADGDGRDALIKPQTDSPLDPLEVPKPPLANLPVMLPPPIPDSGADFWSENLYRYPEVPQGDLDDLIEPSEQPLEGSGVDVGDGMDDEGELELDASDAYAQLYDSVKLDAVRTFYGWIRGEGRYDKKPGDPIVFQQVRPETGQEIFAPRPFENGEYESFAFAKTLRNQIELGVREMRQASAGDTEELRGYIKWLLANGIQEPVAFGYAEELARNLINLAKDDPNTWMTLGMVWERTFRFDEAFTLYGKLAGETLPMSAPKLDLPIEEGRFARNAGIRVGMARILRRLGVDGEAEQLLRRADQLQPGDATTLHALGKVLLDNGRIAEALTYLERVASLPLQRNSDLSLANAYALGCAYLGSGNWQKSQAAFDDMLRAAGGKDQAVEARLGLVAGFYLSGDFTRALQEAVDAVDVFGAQPDLLYMRALATAADGGSAAEVVRDLRAAAAAAPLDAGPALAALAFWYDVMGMETEASETLERALDLQPDLVYGRYLRARWAARDGQVDAASEELRGLVASNPRCAGALVELGWLLHQIPAAEAAEVAFRRAALALPQWASNQGNAPQWADLALRRGLNQMDLANWQFADEMLREAVSLDAAHYSAQNALAAVAYASGDLTQAIADFSYLQDNLRQDQASLQFLHAQMWQDRIQRHSKLRRWEDPFDGSRLRPGWEVQSGARKGVGPALRDGRLTIRGNHNEQGRTRATRSVVALHFQSFAGELIVGDDHLGEAGLMLAIETRQGRATWTFKVFRDRDGYLVHQWKQGAKEERKKGRKLPTNVPIPISFELDREPVTPELTVRVDGDIVYQGTAAVLKSSSGSLVYGLYAETSNALPVNTALDNVNVVFSQP
jgi:tetratricopeptide (TPR) repeat protein